ncbi:MAG: hypothetical protein UT63_C0018G0010 [Candidatus Gottesmanbacteria bacterium GW2011_GWC2_39_8]|uniref:Uncharacterized protein n=1 Tax=Candidatus Gottesmanbacteria bacterium GW2011_GWC2_39_8 TaxID=1618450 RepID=A0A0G0SF71_9BACT|nr:MAG: hypothetical protein UT63_C0018G0010 [Candidatus Gottesmanbacteria bacterium GW2011_GWC2_39_8]
MTEFARLTDLVSWLKNHPGEKRAIGDNEFLELGGGRRTLSWDGSKLKIEGVNVKRKPFKPSIVWTNSRRGFEKYRTRGNRNPRMN